MKKPEPIQLLDEVLKRMTTDALKAAVNQGLMEVVELVETKPKNWGDQLPLIEKTLRAITDELKRRGEQ